ncbi:hypothetical protein [Sphingopyxis panaciterrulae]|uniref:DUF4440 domain-containing protein n=1 Tax=Sphingopyxis panaciterrulae TaxID=462372 RepID=A0A7W9B2E4_9SPHN|nr:hypothetical protein [Sphingopyxis panaciterrulae]MBB5704981.1 hypothetical protein [Sphingopyxis panaciterrulae]
MRRLLLPALALFLVAGCTSPSGRGDLYNRPLAANPSAFIAAELAFARLARDKGQWTAFRETAADDAVMFMPQRVLARDWLKAKPDPAQAVSWQPHAVYVSCDGNSGATTGAWQKGPTFGYFTTIWRRDPRKGEMRWVLDHGAELTTPREAPDFIESKQAVCGSRPDAVATAADEGAAVGLSDDRTLSWTSIARSDGSRRVTVRMWDGSAMTAVIDDRVPAPGQ